jgi:phage-related protein
MASTIEIIINATDNASRHINAVENSIQRLGSSAGKVTGAVTAMSGALAGMAPVVAGAGALASSFASAGLASVAFGAVAISSIGGVIEKTKEISDLEEKIANADTAQERAKYQKQLEQAMAGVSKAQRGAIADLQEFTGWWGKFTTEFDKPVFKVFGEGLDLIRNTMTAMKPAIMDVGNVLGDFMESVNNSFKTEPVQKFFDYINRSAGSNLSAILQTASNLFQGFFNILMAFEPLSQSFNAGMVSMTQRFADWSAQLASSQSFQNFVRFVQANTPPLLSLIGNLWNFIVQLVQALAPLGSVVLQVASSFAQWLATSSTMQSVLQGISSAGQFLGQHMTAVKVAVLAVVTAFVALRTALTIIAIVQTAVTVFTALKTAFLAVRTATIAMNTALYANPFMWIIGIIVAVIAIGVLLYQNWDLIKEKAIALWNWMKQVWTGIKTAVTQAVTAIKAKVLEFATGLSTWFTNAMNLAKTAVQTGITAIVTAFSQLGMKIATWVIQTGAKLYTGFVNMMNRAKTAVQAGITAVINFFVQLGSRIASTVTSIASRVASGFSNMMSRARSLVSSGVSAIVSFFSKLASSVASAVSNMASRVASFFSNMMSRARSLVSSGASAIRSAFSSMASAISSVISSMASRVSSLFSSMMSRARSLITSGASAIRSAFTSMASAITSAISSLASRLVSLFTSMMSRAKSAVTSGITGMVSAIKGFAGQFLSAGKGLIEAFTNGIKSAMGKAKSAVESGMSSIRDMLPFSPAKEGPLSDLDKSGESFFPTWYEGALKKVSNMERAIGGAMGTLNSQLQKETGQVELASFGASARQVLTIRVEGDVNVQGDSSSEQVNFVAEQTRAGVAEMELLKGMRQAIRKR